MGIGVLLSVSSHEDPDQGTNEGRVREVEEAGPQHFGAEGQVRTLSIWGKVVGKVEHGGQEYRLCSLPRFTSRFAHAASLTLGRLPASLPRISL